MSGKLFLVILFWSGISGAWTHRFVTLFSAAQQQQNSARDAILFTLDSKAFTQAMVCWNAHRPLHGHYSFWIQVRAARDGAWDEWKKMAEWGKDIQASFLTKNDQGFSNFHHVRLEVNNGAVANGVRIKIKAHDGADLSGIALISVTTSDYRRFADESPDTVAAQLSSVMTKGVPCYSQMVLDHPKKEVLCSTTSTSMLINYLYQKEQVNPVTFAYHAYDTGLNAYGSWPFNTAAAFVACQGTTFFIVSRCNSFTDLHAYLLKGVPVIVSVRGELRGGAKEYNQGHLLIVVGYDAKKRKVLCHDPAFPSNRCVPTSYDLDTFLDGWQRSRRLVYLAYIKK